LQDLQKIVYPAIFVIMRKEINKIERMKVPDGNEILGSFAVDYPFSFTGISSLRDLALSPGALCFAQ
jgi:hypothetical protein